VKANTTASTGAPRPIRPYEAPSVTELGTLHELTLGTNKDLGGSDGLTFQQQPITWTSP
jgi:hypothetical protein